MVKPILVPDTLRLDPLLALLREDGFQMAVVLDEYGGQAGIVTLEDVVEEIVGDIADEHDPRAQQARQLRDGSWSLSGLLRPDEVADLTEVELPEDVDYDTIAGLVLQVLGKVPAVGDTAEVWVPDRAYDAGHDANELGRRLAVLTVTHMDGLRIDRVALKLITDDRAATDGGEHA
jgi:CBS domain containing-hemolysin-like protein